MSNKNCVCTFLLFIFLFPYHCYAGRLSDDDLIKKKYQYNIVFKTMFAATYLVGKPANSVLESVPNLFTSALTGLVVGGVAGSIANLVKDIGVDKALDILRKKLNNARGICKFDCQRGNA